MYILALKTASPQAEIYLYDDKTLLAKDIWLADRQLADTIHHKIEILLKNQKISYEQLGGLAVFKGPGSFTGLRIGISVANALAYGLDIPITGANQDNWQEQAIKNLLANKGDKIVFPEYGAEPNISVPRK